MGGFGSKFGLSGIISEKFSTADSKPGFEAEAPKDGPGILGIAGTGAGVEGISNTGAGVEGISNGGPGVNAGSQGGIGVDASSVGGAGIRGISTNSEGIRGETSSATMAAIAGYNNNPNGTGAAIYGEKAGDGDAGFFAGNVTVTKNVYANNLCMPNGDCAEEFDISAEEQDSVQPGMVMVLDEEGTVSKSRKAYDKRVVGVISGAGTYKAAIVLDKQAARPNRKPIALLGKAFCLVDAGNGPIEVGDMLTTSNVVGHAMRLSDPIRGFGTSIGKAMRSHRQGRGMIPVLIRLQ